MSTKWIVVLWSVALVAHFVFQPNPTVEDLLLFIILIATIYFTVSPLEKKITDQKEHIDLLEERIDRLERCVVDLDDRVPKYEFDYDEPLADDDDDLN